MGEVGVFLPARTKQDLFKTVLMEKMVQNEK